MKEVTISEKTKITLGLCLTVATVLVGVGMNLQKLSDFDRRLTRMESKMDLLLEARAVSVASQ